MLGSLKWMALLASIALVACAPEDNGGGGGGGGDDDDDGNGVIDAGGNGGFIDATDLPEGPDAAPGACDKIDILFVIDNSGSMAEEQDNLASNFPMFAQLIDTYMNSAGMQLDYHVAVTTTDRVFSSTQIITLPGQAPIMLPGESGTGADGKLLTKGNGPDCGMPRKYLQRGDQDVVNKFSCIAKQGTSGSPDEMPLDAMKLALVDRVTDGTNAGFLRPDALLAVVFLTDEEDCSINTSNLTYNSGLGDFCHTVPLGPVAQYVQAIDQAKGGERGRWAVAAIAGPGPGKCSSPYGGADEATRLKQFTQMVGANAVFSSICDANLASSLQAAFEKFSAACEAFPPVD